MLQYRAVALLPFCLAFSLTALAQHDSQGNRDPKPQQQQKQSPDGQQDENNLFDTQRSNGGLLAGTGTYDGPGGFDRGMQSTMYCSNDPESWIRGSAFLDTSNGDITVHMDLETDSVSAGPRGKIKVTVIDGDGNSLATAETNEVGIGGKRPGTFRLVKISGSASVPAELANRAASMRVEAECTGSQGGLFGIDLKQAIDALQIVVQAVEAVHLEWRDEPAPLYALKREYAIFPIQPFYS